MKIENEEMIMTIKPGTRQWDGDKKMELKERSGILYCEWKKLIKRNKFIKLSYDLGYKNNSKLFKNEKNIDLSIENLMVGKFPGYSPQVHFMFIKMVQQHVLIIEIKENQNIYNYNITLEFQVI